jgi:ADP-ribose pyrophosphatase YjhB (NUDIX family)
MAREERFHFCPKCGGELARRAAGERKRLVCRACGYVMYENPIVGVAAIVLDGDRILLGRRAAGSTYPGRWCIPCGYVEYDEDVRAAVVRECREETGLEIAVGEVFTVLSNWHNPETHTVGIWFMATVTGGRLKPGDDLDAADFFPLAAPPPLAFPTDGQVIAMLGPRQATKGDV